MVNKAVMDRASAALTREDSWSNVISGVGLARDKRIYSVVQPIVLAQQDLDYLYRYDDIAGRIVDEIPTEALKEGFTITGHPDSKNVMDRANELNATQSIVEAAKYARLYGGGAVLVVSKDTADFSMPIADDAKIVALRSLGACSLTISEKVTDISDPRYGEPLYYQISTYDTATNNLSGKKIHFSRVIPFFGVDVGPNASYFFAGWKDSVLIRLYPILRDYGSSFEAMASLVPDFAQGIYRMKGLADMMAQGQEEVVIARLRVMDASKSVIRSILLDAETETYERIAQPVAGLDGIISKIEMRLVASSGMPHTRLLGDSPSGLGATGASEKEDWICLIEGYQQSVIKNPLVRLLTVIMGDIGKRRDGWDVVFNSLRKASEAEKLEMRERQAAVDEKYINTTVLTAMEVRKSRFGGEAGSLETKIDQGSMSKVLDAVPVPKEDKKKDGDPTPIS